MSHDRHLVSLLAESLLIAADSRITTFPGTFKEWTDDQREAEVAAAPGGGQQKARPASRAQPARTRDPKRRNPAAPVIDMEQVITDLEDRLKQIEDRLQEATLGQDLDEMTRLADEHARTKAELEQRLEEWEE